MFRPASLDDVIQLSYSPFFFFFSPKKCEWREVWRCTPTRWGLSEILTYWYRYRYSNLSRPAYFLHAGRTTHHPLQSLWIKSSSSWKERTAEKTVQTPRSLFLHYCVGVLFFFFSVLQHFSDQKLLLLFSMKKLKPQMFSLSHSFSQADTFISARWLSLLE